jgi:hypothetical protein
MCHLYNAFVYTLLNIKLDLTRNITLRPQSLADGAKSNNLHRVFATLLHSNPMTAAVAVSPLRRRTGGEGGGDALRHSVFAPLIPG